MSWRRKLGLPLLSAGLAFGVFAPQAFASTDGNANPVEKNVAPEFNYKYSGQPFDQAIVNEDRLLSSLIKQGVIDKNQSHDKQVEALHKYLSERAKKTEQSVDNKAATEDFNKKGLKIHANPNAKKNKAQKAADLLKNNNGKHLGFKNKLDPVQQEKWDGKVRKDNVLVLLIQFPDKKHGTVDPKSTDMYYKDYTREHYQNMIFGENGYKGPNGENLISMRQFYEEQSGGSYTVDGNVAGWYTAEHPAAYYGGNDPESGSDKNARALIREALEDAAKDPNVNLNEYDKTDLMDLDGDGNVNEPDGLIDHLMVLHSGVGEEAGGGTLGADAIWSHSWDVNNEDGTVPYVIPGTQTDVGYWGGQLGAFNYTVEPEDGAAGVFAHEYGHDLGLPDEYDTIYSHGGVGAPTGYWTLMSSGSWTGAIPGTEPSGFNTYDKEYLQSTMPGSNWYHGLTVNVNDLKDGKALTTKLDASSLKGTGADGVRINLPDKETVVNQPATGDYEFFSGSANDLTNSMTADVDLSGSSKAELSFKAWYDIESYYDFAYVEVTDENGDVHTVKGSITTAKDPYNANHGEGITGSSDGWVDANFDLSQFAGQKVTLTFDYVTDAGVAKPGFYVDDVNVTKDGQTVLSAGAEDEKGPFELNGFSRTNGKKYTSQYYMVEWRDAVGSDAGLAHIRRGDSLMTYDSGMVLWYVDNKYTENWVGMHPGEGFLGVVDAHQDTLKWSTGEVASSNYQINDAAFSLDKTDKEYLDYTRYYDGMYLVQDKEKPVYLFDDSRDYTDPGQIYAGKNLPNFGLKIRVVAESHDKTAGAVSIYK